MLTSLPEADFELLRPHCRTVELVNGDILVEAGAPLLQIYFPHSAVISKIVSLAGGESIEVAMIGREGVFGGSAAHYGELSPTAGIVRFPGAASVIDVGHFRAACAQSEPLRAALMQRQWQHIVQAERTAACNAAHSVEARLCRRLLMLRDLARCDELPLTQDILAQMLGVQRNSISLVAIELQQAGLLRYSRGHLEITDVDGLIERSCECYERAQPHGGGPSGTGDAPGRAAPDSVASGPTTGSRPRAV
ncbi:Crp/Fnr family transcriptional regulator [Rhodopseudomonas sp.]|uniref:Crp/Fnr family transcriptional regulator n=1 Tax=Rhodopseudomonas sp. TaxID=1078 RepID=UPI003456DD82